MKYISLTFPGISHKFLKMCITEGARRIVVTFDQYITLSIKDNELLVRGSKEARPFYIHGPDQRLPEDFSLN